MSILNSLLSTADACGRSTAYFKSPRTTWPTSRRRASSSSGRCWRRARDPEYGTLGGVRAGDIASSRDLYAEQAVRRQNVLLGRDQQNVSSLTALESVFDISGESGIPNALNNLFDSFSSWAQSPSGEIARQNVMERADNLAKAFHQTADSIANVTVDAETQIQHTVDAINRLSLTLQGFNQQALRGYRADPTLDAQIHSTLEELSQYGEITALHQADGSVTVLLNGQTPLVVADKQYAIGYHLESPTTPPPVYAGARPLARITAADGTDITSLTNSGQLGALVDFRNRVLVSYVGDAWHQGDLNHMAEQLATRINGLLASGGGEPLLTFDASNPATIAQTLSLNPAITAGQLAASSPGTAGGVERHSAGARGARACSRRGGQDRRHHVHGILRRPGGTCRPRVERCQIAGSGTGLNRCPSPRAAGSCLRRFARRRGGHHDPVPARL